MGWGWRVYVLGWLGVGDEALGFGGSGFRVQIGFRVQGLGRRVMRFF